MNVISMPCNPIRVIAVEPNVHRSLLNFGVKVALAGTVQCEKRIHEMVQGTRLTTMSGIVFKGHDKPQDRKATPIQHPAVTLCVGELFS